jgi:hypothetical protein
MRNIKLRLAPLKVLLGTVFFVLASCSPEYIPNVVNTPMFDEQGELQANLSAGVSGTDVQAAYALTDNVGVMLNSSFNRQVSDTTEDYHKHTILEFGLGYYGSISDYGRYEIYGGYGAGRIKGYDEDNIFDSQITDATFGKIFLQPSFGFKSNYFDGSMGARIALVRVDYKNDSEGLSEKFHPFVEPVITGRLGIKNVKVVSQVGLSFPFKDEHVFDYQPFIFSLGLHFRINTMGSGADE